MIAVRTPLPTRMCRTQHCEEQARVAVWELHTIIFKIRGTCQENKDTFFESKTGTGAISRTGVSHGERERVESGLRRICAYDGQERPF